MCTLICEGLGVGFFYSRFSMVVELDKAKSRWKLVNLVTKIRMTISIK